MNKLILRNFYDGDFKYSDDVTRIVEVCKAKDLEIDEQTAKRSWELYSEDMSAGWIHLPDEDEWLLDIIMRYTEIQVQPDAHRARP